MTELSRTTDAELASYVWLWDKLHLAIAANFVCDTDFHQRLGLPARGRAFGVPLEMG